MESIYIVECDTGHFYYGRTRTTLSQRMCCHTCESKRGVSQSKLYIQMRQGGNWTIREVEKVKKEDARQKEEQYIIACLSNPMCLNMRREKWNANDKKEYDKKWNEEHKEHAKQTKHEYYEKNKEHLRQKQKEWKEANKDKLKEYKRQWYMNNKE